MPSTLLTRAIVVGAIGAAMFPFPRSMDATQANAAADPAKFLTQPLVSEIYTADPSAHVFAGRLYVYPSHDIEAGVAEDDLGSHFAMRDYRVLSMDTVGGAVTVHGVALDIKDVPWARRRRPRRQVLSLLPREGQAGRLPDWRGRFDVADRTVQG
jgi:hypothetical protein